jgi:hypothetical protein
MPISSVATGSPPAVHGACERVDRRYSGVVGKLPVVLLLKPQRRDGRRVLDEGVLRFEREEFQWRSATAGPESDRRRLDSGVAR